MWATSSSLKQHIDGAKYILLLTKEPNNTINHKKKTIVMPATSYKHTNFAHEDALLRKTTCKQLYFCMHCHASCTMENEKRYRPLASDVPHQKDKKLVSTHSHTNLFQFFLSPHTLCHLSSSIHLHLLNANIIMRFLATQHQP
jgi:hypothetical protein